MLLFSEKLTLFAGKLREEPGKKCQQQKYHYGPCLANFSKCKIFLAQSAKTKEVGQGSWVPVDLVLTEKALPYVDHPPPPSWRSEVTCRLNIGEYMPSSYQLERSDWVAKQASIIAFWRGSNSRCGGFQSPVRSVSPGSEKVVLPLTTKGCNDFMSKSCWPCNETSGACCPCVDV